MQCNFIICHEAIKQHSRHALSSLVAVPPLGHSNNTATTTACQFIVVIYMHEPSHCISCITTAGVKLPPLHHNAVAIALRLMCLCILLASIVIDCCLYNNIVNSPNTIAVCTLTACCSLADAAD